MGGLRGVVMMQTSGFARARRLKRIRHCRSSEARRPSREAARSLNRTASLSAIGFYNCRATETLARTGAFDGLVL